jgi:hypothetical protein
MTASRRPGDRLTVCPSCGRDVRVTDDELAVGRSFCAACGQRFAVEEKTVGESPFRAIATIQADDTRPPDARIAVRPDGAIDVFARSATRRTALGLGGMALITASGAFAAWTLFSGRPDWGFLLMLGVSLPSLCAAAWAAAGSHERIRLDGDTLVLATGPFGLRKRRIPVREIDRISIEGNVVSLTLRSGDRVGIAANCRVPAQATAWLHARLTEMVPGAALPHREEDRADLVLAEPQPPTPRMLAGTSSLTIHSARAPEWHWGGIGAFCSFLAMLLACALAVGKGLEIKFPLWILGVVLLPAIGAFVVADRLPPALRHWLGHDDLEIRDGALWYRKKGLLRGAWQRTPLADIHTIRVEEDSGGRDRWRVRVHRTGQKPFFLGQGLGHDKNAISWLAAWLRREIDAAATSEARALPE